MGPLRRLRPFEQAAAVGAAVGGLHRALRVRHHAEHVAGFVDDAGDVAGRAVHSPA
jgi:hypothetical protein